MRNNPRMNQPAQNLDLCDKKSSVAFLLSFFSVLEIAFSVLLHSCDGLCFPSLPPIISLFVVCLYLIELFNLFFNDSSQELDKALAFCFSLIRVSLLVIQVHLKLFSVPFLSSSSVGYLLFSLSLFTSYQFPN